MSSAMGFVPVPNTMPTTDLVSPSPLNNVSSAVAATINGEVSQRHVEGVRLRRKGPGALPTATDAWRCVFFCWVIFCTDVNRFSFREFMRGHALGDFPIPPTSHFDTPCCGFELRRRSTWSRGRAFEKYKHIQNITASKHTGKRGVTW